MLELIIGIVATVLFSCSHVWIYRRGLKDGKALSEGKPIEPIKTPVQAFNEVKQAKEISKEEKEQAQFMNNLFEYTGEVQKGVKE